MKPSPGQANDKSKPSILKKSSSARQVVQYPLFCNETLKGVRKHQVSHANQTIQNSIREEIKRVRKSNAGRDQTVKELGHKLIEQLRDYSEDHGALSKIVVEFLACLGAQDSDKIVSHFGNVVKLTTCLLEGKQKSSTPRNDNSVKQILVYNQTLEDRLADSQRQLRLFTDLLGEEKKLTQTLQTKLSRMQNQQATSAKNQSVTDLQIQHMRISNTNLEEELRRADADIKRVKSNLAVSDQKVHCIQVENQGLHSKNKCLQRQLYDRVAEWQLLSLGRQTLIEGLQKQNAALLAGNQRATLQNRILGSKRDQLLEEGEQWKTQQQEMKEKMTEMSLKLTTCTNQLKKLESQFKNTVHRQGELSRLLQEQKLQSQQLHTRIRQIEQESAQKPSLTMGKPKSSHKSQKIKALQDIQALIRKHKTDQ